MSQKDTQSKQLLTDGIAASPTALAAAREGDACAEGGGLPRLVIRGESLEGQTNPDNGDRYQLVSKGGHAHLISHPLPKVDGVAFAAITDYLNCTFHFIHLVLLISSLNYLHALVKNSLQPKNVNAAFMATPIHTL